MYALLQLFPTVLSTYRGIFFACWFSELEVLEEIRCYPQESTGLQEK